MDSSASGSWSEAISSPPNMVWVCFSYTSIVYGVRFVSISYQPLKRTFGLIFTDNSWSIDNLTCRFCSWVTGISFDGGSLVSITPVLTLDEFGVGLTDAKGLNKIFYCIHYRITWCGWCCGSQELINKFIDVLSLTWSRTSFIFIYILMEITRAMSTMQNLLLIIAIVCMITNVFVTDFFLFDISCLSQLLQTFSTPFYFGFSVFVRHFSPRCVSWSHDKHVTKYAQFLCH